MWVADITYIPTLSGFLYLAVVLDAFSRRIVGWSMENDLGKQVVIDALDMAIHQRKPVGVIHHSDQGSQYPRLPSGFGAKKPALVLRWERSQIAMVSALNREPGITVDHRP